MNDRDVRKRFFALMEKKNPSYISRFFLDLLQEEPPRLVIVQKLLEEAEEGFTYEVLDLMCKSCLQANRFPLARQIVELSENEEDRALLLFLIAEDTHKTRDIDAVRNACTDIDENVAAHTREKLYRLTGFASDLQELLRALDHCTDPDLKMDIFCDLLATTVPKLNIIFAAIAAADHDSYGTMDDEEFIRKLLEYIVKAVIARADTDLEILLEAIHRCENLDLKANLLRDLLTEMPRAEIILAVFTAADKDDQATAEGKERADMLVDCAVDALEQECNENLIIRVAQDVASPVIQEKFFEAAIALWYGSKTFGTN